MRRLQGWLAAALLTLLTVFGALAQPANDDINNAVVTSVPDAPPSIDTTEATTAPDDPECVGQGPTVWYRLTPAVSQRVEFNTFGSSYDTTLSAYTGSPGALTQIVCNDDTPTSLQSRVRFDAVAGETYFIMVGAFASGPGGSLVLSVAVAPPAPEFHVTIDKHGAFSRTGVATVTGTVTCSIPAFVNVFGELVQSKGPRKVVGGFFTQVSCDGTAVWRSEASGLDGLFGGGKAATSVVAEFFRRRVRQG